MDIERFRARVCDLLSYVDDDYEDDGLEWIEESLVIHPVMDGCLAAEFRGEAIQCEGLSWDKALDEIIMHIEQRVAAAPPGWYDASAARPARTGNVVNHWRVG
jgi:hypothetical protein